jgi:hypothetical protein
MAKALNITGINCPVRQLADGAIENNTVTGLLPQASLRGAQIQEFLDRIQLLKSAFVEMAELQIPPCLGQKNKLCIKPKVVTL